MSLEDRERELAKNLLNYTHYAVIRFDRWDYSVLRWVNTVTKRAGGLAYRANEAVIMADTETSKNPEHKEEVYENHVVAWTISIRIAGVNLVTLYGTRPSEHVETIKRIHDAMPGNRTYIFYHNMSYDWVFLRRFYLDFFGEPERQLNTKPHYPVSIEFANGIILRDSLILAQRSLERWANDLNVPHKKAVNEWDYNKIRDQGGEFAPDELEYIEHDTLAGVECIDAFRASLHKTIATLPYTATGIVREQFRAVAKRKENHGRQWFERQVLDYDYVKLSEAVYHGGFTHCNRFAKSSKIDYIYTDGENVECYDITSSYPFALLSEKYPSGKFVSWHDLKPEDIIKASDEWAFMFILCLYMPELKDPFYPMPFLQYSKTTRTYNDITDNGRIVKADYVEIAICDVDLRLILQQYNYNTDYTYCTSVIMTRKDYLPRWFTDFVYKLFEDKTQLKGGDPVLYALAKSKLNSCYGMCCQHVMSNDIIEDYETGEYTTDLKQTAEDYQKYLDNRNSFLPYQIGIYCTAYATKNLFELGACVKDPLNWLYSDTDSCFAFGWDENKLKEYNAKRIRLMRDRGYHGVKHNNKIYHLGIVELDKVCSEFVGIHSKCYAYRDVKDGKLKITVAGVPKKGAECLDNNIDNFRVGFIFPGSQTGKLTHSYLFQDLHRDSAKNEIADSINLSHCDYLISDANTISWEDLTSEDITMRVYDE